MPTCPNGHQSGSDDWCEVCGHRMAGPGAPTGAVPPPPPPPPPAPGYGYPPGPGPNATVQAELCPQCRTPREPMAPFCEECRWNFLTNTATSYTPLAPQQPGPGGPVPGLNLPPGFQAQQPPRPPADPYEYQSSRPSQLNRPAEPLSPEPPSPPSAPSPQNPHQQGPPPPPPYQQQGPPPPPAFQQGSAAPQAPSPTRPAGDDDWMLPPPSAASAPAQPGAPGSQQHAQSQSSQQSQAHARAQVPQQHDPMRQYQQPPAGWTAVIGPDREYFMAMMQRSGPEATGLNLPAYSPEQRLPLAGNQVTIGRRRHSTGESPEIDLSVPPEDPGVSHQHAVLVHQPDGSWAVVDQNSTNGTTINGAEDPIQPYVPVPLKDGDRVHVGAWTTITIRRG
ncbi:FHA domain-containing protein [Streptomyces sp. 35G-GA-8]|uniref:FHA domain-containing protein n=1 Tax=Streptomyces sp. 35G-GA-8 TaxID=2939434 RepID=UPI00201F1399|nr:FHA domain-containing protein [Streptomyces sp. 35G-GA-8]MCL7377407.1 FHA domain-containing protein [Streptomyces sp. 35G-GA-8]